MIKNQIFSILLTLFLSSYIFGQQTKVLFLGNSYTSVNNLQPGEGYWLRFELPYIANISGEAINSLTINLTEGWNLISGITNSITLDSIDDPQDLIVSGTLFKYNGNYIVTETVDPGCGYWLRSSGDGQIILNYSE